MDKRKPRIWKDKRGWVIDWNHSTHSGIPSFEQAVEQWGRYLVSFAQYYPKDWWVDFA